MVKGMTKNEEKFYHFGTLITLRTSSKTRRLSVRVEVPSHESRIGVVVSKISAASSTLFFSMRRIMAFESKNRT